jgi:hypothetical protein
MTNASSDSDMAFWSLRNAGSMKWRWLTLDSVCRVSSPASPCPLMRGDFRCVRPGRHRFEPATSQPFNNLHMRLVAPGRAEFVRLAD